MALWRGGYRYSPFEPQNVSSEDVFWFLDLETNWIPKKQGKSWRERQVPLSFSVQPFGYKEGQWTHLRGGFSGKFNVGELMSPNDIQDMLDELGRPSGASEDVTLSEFLGIQADQLHGRGTVGYKAFAERLHETVLQQPGKVIIGGQNLNYDIPIIDQLMRNSGLDPILGRSNVHMAETISLHQRVKLSLTGGSSLNRITQEYGNQNIAGMAHEARYDVLQTGYAYGNMLNRLLTMSGINIPGVNTAWYPQGAGDIYSVNPIQQGVMRDYTGRALTPGVSPDPGLSNMSYYRALASGQVRQQYSNTYSPMQYDDATLARRLQGRHGVGALLSDPTTLFGSSYAQQGLGNLAGRFGGSQWQMDIEQIGDNTRLNVLRTLRGGGTQSLTFDVQSGPMTEFGKSFQVMTPTGSSYFVGSSIHAGVKSVDGTPTAQFTRHTPTQNLARLIMGAFYQSDVAGATDPRYTPEMGLSEIIQSGLRVPGTSKAADQWLIQPGMLLGSPNEYEDTLTGFAQQMPLYIQSRTYGQPLTFTQRQQAYQQISSATSALPTTHPSRGVLGALRAGGYFVNEQGRLERGYADVRFQYDQTSGQVTGMDPFMLREPSKYISKSTVYRRRLPVHPLLFNEKSRQLDFAPEFYQDYDNSNFITRADRKPVYGRLNALYPGETQVTNAFIETALYAESGIPGGGVQFGNRYSQYYGMGVERTKGGMLDPQQLSLDVVMRQGGHIQFRDNLFGREVRGGMGNQTFGWVQRIDPASGKPDPTRIDINIGESSFVPLEGEMVIPRYAMRTSSGQWMPVRTMASVSGDQEIIDMTQYEGQLSERFGVPVRATGITKVGWKIRGAQLTGTKVGGEGVKYGRTPALNERFLGEIDVMTGELKQPAVRMWSSFAAMSPYQQVDILDEWSRRVAANQGSGDPRAFMRAVRAEYPYNYRGAQNPVTGESPPPIMNPDAIAKMAGQAGIIERGSIGWEVFGSMFGTLFGEAPRTEAQWTTQTDYLKRFGVGWRDVGDVPLPQHSLSSLRYLKQSWTREYNALQQDQAFAGPVMTAGQAFNRAFRVEAVDPAGRRAAGQNPLFNIWRRNVTGLQMTATAPFEAEYAGGMKLNYEAQYALSVKYPELAKRVNAHIGFTDEVSEAWGRMYQWATFQSGAMGGGDYAAPARGNYIPISMGQIENIQTRMLGISKDLTEMERMGEMRKIIAGEVGASIEDPRMLYSKDLGVFIPPAQPSETLEFSEHGMAIARTSTMYMNMWGGLGNAATDQGHLPVGSSPADVLKSQRESAIGALSTMYKFYTKIFNAGEDAMKRVTGQQRFGLGGIGGRYSNLPALEINEMYLPRVELERLFGSAGIPKAEWGEAKRILAEEGYIPGVAWRYPQLDVGAGYRGMKILGPEQMVKQGKMAPDDPLIMAGRTMKAGDPLARNVAYVSTWFAELMAGDFDYDPYAMLALIRHGDDRPLEIIKDPQVQAEIEQNFTGIFRDTENYLKAMFPDPRIRRQTSALQDSLQQIMAEQGLLIDKDTGQITSPENVIRGFKTFGYRSRHFAELANAAEQYNINKMGMGRSYNMRRMLEAAGAVQGRTNEALTQAWSAAAQHYQPHLDLYFGAVAGAEAVASSFFQFKSVAGGPSTSQEREIVKGLGFYDQDKVVRFGLSDDRLTGAMKRMAQAVLRPEDMKGMAEVDITSNVLFSYMFSRNEDEMLKLNELLQGATGAQRVDRYLQYLDAAPNAFGGVSALAETPIMMGATAAALRKRDNPIERKMAEEYIRVTRGDDYLGRVLATETVYNLSAASKTGTTPAVKYMQTLEVLSGQPGLSIYGSFAASVIERGVGGEFEMMPATGGSGIGGNGINRTVAGLLGNFPNPNSFGQAGGFGNNAGLQNMFESVIRASLAAKSSYGRPPNEAEAAALHRAGTGVLRNYSREVTATYRRLPEILENVYGSAFSNLSSGEALSRLAEGLMAGGGPEFDLAALFREAPELKQVFGNFRGMQRQAKRALWGNVVDLADDPDAFRADLLPMAQYEFQGVPGVNPVTAEAFGNINAFLGSVPMSQIRKKFPARGQTTDDFMDSLSQYIELSGEIETLAGTTPGRSPYQKKAHSQKMAHLKAQRRHMASRVARIQIAQNLGEQNDVPFGEIPTSLEELEQFDPYDAYSQTPALRRALQTENEARLRATETGAKLEPLSEADTKNLQHISGLIRDVSKATADYNKVLKDNKSSLDDINAAAEKKAVSDARLATGIRGGQIAGALGVEPRDIHSLRAMGRARVSQLEGMTRLTPEQSAELDALSGAMQGMEDDDLRLTEAMRRQQQGARGRRWWSRLGGFSRRLFGGFGMMYLGTVGRMAIQGASLGYAESLAAQQGAITAVGGAFGGISGIDTPEMQYQRALSTYGGYGMRAMRGFQADVMENYPGAYQAGSSAIGALGAGGAAMWIMGLAGVTGPAAPIVGGVVAATAFAGTQYASYRGAMQEPLQTAASLMSRPGGYPTARVAYQRSIGNRASNTLSYTGGQDIYSRIGRGFIQGTAGIAKWLGAGGDTTLMAAGDNAQVDKYASAIKALADAELLAGAGGPSLGFDYRGVLDKVGITSPDEQGAVYAAYLQQRGAGTSGVTEQGRFTAGGIAATFGLGLSPDAFNKLGAMVDQGVPIVETAGAMAMGTQQALGGTRTGEMLTWLIDSGMSSRDMQKIATGSNRYQQLGPWAALPDQLDPGTLAGIYQYMGDNVSSRGYDLLGKAYQMSAVESSLTGMPFVRPKLGAFVGTIDDTSYGAQLRAYENWTQELGTRQQIQQIMRNAGVAESDVLDRGVALANMTPNQRQYELETRLMAEQYVQNLEQGFSITQGMSNYLSTRFQGGDYDMFSRQQWGTLAAAAGRDPMAMAQVWSQQFLGQMPSNAIGLNMLDQGYLIRNDIYQSGPMRGMVSTQPLFTNTMNWGGMNATGVAEMMWGANWAQGGPTLPAAPGGPHVSMRQAMVNQIPLVGQQDIFGNQMMLGGRNAVQYMQSNLSYESSMASAGLALEGIALQMAFQTGVGLSGYNTVNPQTGQPFGFNTGRFSWNVPGVGSGRSTGGGLWGVQDALRDLNYAQQGYAFDRQGQQLEMTSRFFYQNIGLSQQQSSMQRRWAQEDWGFQDQQRALSWAWRQEDFAEQSRFMTGRQRRLAERQMQRETISYGIEGEQIEKQRERQKELWALEDQRFNLQKSQHEEQKKFQEDSIETNRKFFEERKKLEEEMQKLQRAFQVEQWELAKKQAATQAYYAQKAKEVNDEMLAIARNQQMITDLQAAADAGNLEAIRLLDLYWDQAITRARQALNIPMPGRVGQTPDGGEPSSNEPQYSMRLIKQDDNYLYYDTNNDGNWELKVPKIGGSNPDDVPDPTLELAPATNPWSGAVISDEGNGNTVLNNFAIYIGEQEIQEYIVQTVKDNLEAA